MKYLNFCLLDFSIKNDRYSNLLKTLYKYIKMAIKRFMIVLVSHNFIFLNLESCSINWTVFFRKFKRFKNFSIGYWTLKFVFKIQSKKFKFSHKWSLSSCSHLCFNKSFQTLLMKNSNSKYLNIFLMFTKSNFIF